MDFIVGFAGIRANFDAIWVIINRLTKYVHSLLVSDKYPLKRLIKIYMNEVVSTHEMLVSNALYREARITPRFWQTCQENFGTKFNLNTVYHSSTDEQSKRTIQTIEDMLRACTLDFKKKLG